MYNTSCEILNTWNICYWAMPCSADFLHNVVCLIYRTDDYVFARRSHDCNRLSKYAKLFIYRS